MNTDIKLKKKNGITTLGRPRKGLEPQIGRSVSFDAEVLKALQAQDLSVSACVNEACRKYYLIG